MDGLNYYHKSENSRKYFPGQEVQHGHSREMEQHRQCGCCCSVPKLCPTLCDPMDCSTPGFLVLHCLPEYALIHVH